MGLENLGNTCFMSAGLQCLSHIEPLSFYFLTGAHVEDIRRRGSGSISGTAGALARSFCSLQEHLWQPTNGSKVHTPKEMHGTLRRFAPHLFDRYKQQDAQEFLAYFLDGLHEDLNRASGPFPAPPDDDESADSVPDEQAAEASWARHTARHRSFLVDLFQGQLRSCVSCKVCGLKSKIFDPYLHLSVPAPGASAFSVSDALRLFVATETLCGNERWWCPRCKKLVDAQKRIDVWKFPPVLVIHLKRFEYDARRQNFRKISGDLKCPLTVDLTEFVVAPGAGSQVFDLVGVANHLGPYGSGHYTATCKHPLDGKFYTFNDRHVQESPISDESLTHGGYIVFLVQNPELSARPTVATRQPPARPKRPASRPASASVASHPQSGAAAGLAAVKIGASRTSSPAPKAKTTATSTGKVSRPGSAARVASKVIQPTPATAAPTAASLATAVATLPSAVDDRSTGTNAGSDASKSDVAIASKPPASVERKSAAGRSASSAKTQKPKASEKESAKVSASAPATPTKTLTEAMPLAGMSSATAADVPLHVLKTSPTKPQAAAPLEVKRRQLSEKESSKLSSKDSLNGVSGELPLVKPHTCVLAVRQDSFADRVVGDTEIAKAQLECEAEVPIVCSSRGHSTFLSAGQGLTAAPATLSPGALPTTSPPATLPQARSSGSSSCASGGSLPTSDFKDIFRQLLVVAPRTPGGTAGAGPVTVSL